MKIRRRSCRGEFQLLLFAASMLLLCLAGVIVWAPMGLAYHGRSGLEKRNNTLVYLPLVSKLWPVVLLDRILISEVCYDPLGTEPDGEWFEIFNAGTNSVDLSSYKIGDAARQGDKEGMLQFPPGVVIEPGEVFVIAYYGEVFFNTYGWYPDFEMYHSLQLVPDMGRYLAWANRYVELTNLGDEVVLLDGLDRIVDSVSWGTSAFAFFPGAARSVEGGSIERYPANQDTDTAKDWRPTGIPNPGKVDLTRPTPTPTRNPTATNTPVPTITHFSCLCNHHPYSYAYGHSHSDPVYTGSVDQRSYVRSVRARAGWGMDRNLQSWKPAYSIGWV
jgi:hypothetical protein